MRRLEQLKAESLAPAGGIDYIRQSAQMQEARDRYIQGSLTPPGPPTQHGIYASPEWTGQPYPSLGWQNIRQDQEPPEGWPRPPKFNEPGDVPGPPVQYGDPITPQTVKAGYGFIDNGIIEKNLYFYHPDHLGSSSYITDREGRITQHTEYIAFGEVLFEEHSTSKTMPYLFNGKELDQETNLTYFGARYLDMKTSLWLNTDPLAEKTMTPYAYTNNNPIMLVDPTGMESERADHIDVRKNKDGSYTVVGGVANTDKNVYVVDEKGQRTGQILGQMLTEYSFHDERGNAVKGTVINLKDKSGQNFIDNEIKNIGFVDYINNAKGGEPLDFKVRGMSNGIKDNERKQYVYRGMLLDGKIASARDIGNYAAGYVAGVYGMSWDVARFGFDALETKQTKGAFETFMLYTINRVAEGQPTQRAERAGHSVGFSIFQKQQFQRKWKEATRLYPVGPKW